MDNIPMDDNIRALIGNIISIEDKSGNSVNYKPITWFIPASCDKNLPIYKFKFQGQHLITRNNNYIVSYLCIECRADNKISWNTFAKKISKGNFKCQYCLQKPITPKKTLKEIIEISKQEFDDMDSDYIDKYFTKHLTEEEFLHIKPNIISIQNDKFKSSELDNFQYLSALKCNNQTLFTPMFYDTVRDVFEKPIYLKYQCQKCQNEFINRDLWIQKNRVKILCQDCSFCNDTFKIRGEKNILGERITYQSKLEHKFIKFCAENQIVVQDGQKLNYNWNGKNRKYVVDYYLPDLKLLIELKDDHIWHKKQVENGVWKAKMDAVEKYIQENDSQYLLIFPKTYQSSLDNILKQNKIKKHS